MNRVARLTDRLARESQPVAKEYAIRDSTLPGFMLRIRPSGAKTWLVRGQRSNPGKRVTLGSATTLSADAARAQAHAEMSGDRTVPQTKPTTLRFRAFAVQYRERRKSRWKPTTLRTFDSYLRATLLPTFGAKRLEEVSRVDVSTWFYQYSRTAPGGANRALWILQDMLNCASAWNLMSTDARQLHGSIRKNRRPPRGRLLTLDQLHKLGEALTTLDQDHGDDADTIRLILLTGCRSSEIRRLQWSEVHADRIELADAKTGPRTVHLGTTARALLQRRARSKNGPYVFPSQKRPTRPRNTLSRTWKKVRASARLASDIRLHDLRHTFASHAIMNGETLQVTGGLLGHQRYSSTARYAHLSDDFLFSVASRVSREIAGWIGTDWGLSRRAPH